MIEYGPVQEFARGLLDLFGLKVAGQNPSILENNISPGVDILEWFLESKAVGLQRAMDNIPNGAVGVFGVTGNDIVVPQQEWWWVERFTITTNSYAGANEVIFTPAAILPQTGIQLVGQQTPRNGTGANRILSAVAERFWAPSGTTLCILVQEAVVPTPVVTPTARVRYTPLRV